MTTIMNINVDDLDTKFVEDLKQGFAHAALEIRVQEMTSQSSYFTDTHFWDTINMLDWSKEDDDELVVEPVIAFLAQQPLSHIYHFSDILAEKLWQLDTRSHAQVFLDDPEEEGYLSVDDFLYTRCAVVANGKAYYEKILNNPELMPPDLTFEPLLYISLKAYKQKTGKHFIGDSPLHYETYSNKKGWEKQA